MLLDKNNARIPNRIVWMAETWLKFTNLSTDHVKTYILTLLALWEQRTRNLFVTDGWRVWWTDKDRYKPICLFIYVYFEVQFNWHNLGIYKLSTRHALNCEDFSLLHIATYIFWYFIQGDPEAIVQPWDDSLIK